MSKKNVTKLALSRETLKLLRVRASVKAGLIGDKPPPQAPTQGDNCLSQPEWGCPH